MVEPFYRIGIFYKYIKVYTGNKYPILICNNKLGFKAVKWAVKDK